AQVDARAAAVALEAAGVELALEVAEGLPVPVAAHVDAGDRARYRLRGVGQREPGVAARLGVAVAQVVAGEAAQVVPVPGRHGEAAKAAGIAAEGGRLVGAEGAAD